MNNLIPLFTDAVKTLRAAEFPTVHSQAAAAHSQAAADALKNHGAVLQMLVAEADAEIKNAGPVAEKRLAEIEQLKTAAAPFAPAPVTTEANG